MVLIALSSVAESIKWYVHAAQRVSGCNIISLSLTNYTMYPFRSAYSHSSLRKSIMQSKKIHEYLPQCQFTSWLMTVYLPTYNQTICQSRSTVSQRLLSYSRVHAEPLIFVCRPQRSQGVDPRSYTCLCQPLTLAEDGGLPMLYESIPTRINTNTNQSGDLN